MHQDAHMRTTVTLDPDVAQLIDDAMHRDRRTFKEILNDAIRRGLSPAAARPVTPFKVKAHKAQLVAGHDPQGFNRLADDLDDQAILEKAR
jgi:hypothetical protein